MSEKLSAAEISQSIIGYFKRALTDDLITNTFWESLGIHVRAGLQEAEQTAKAEERERCAKIAEKSSRDYSKDSIANTIRRGGGE